MLKRILGLKEAPRTKSIFEDPIFTKPKDNLFNGATGIPDRVYNEIEIDAPVLARFSLPHPGSRLNDAWDRVAFNKLMEKFVGMVEGKHFSICDIDAVMDFYIGNNGDRRYYMQLEAYIKLRKIHCIDYSELPQSILDSIVPYINEIFKSLPFTEVKSDVVEEELLQLK
jgi:hypothetical protein